MVKKTIRRLAERGKMQQAVDTLLDLADRIDDSYLSNSVSGLSGRFYGLESQKNAGTVTTEHYTIQMNNIRQSLYSILDDIPDADANQYAIDPETETPGVLADPPPTPEKDKVRILMFTANTAGEVALDLSKEFSAIREMLDKKKLNDRCEINWVQLVTPKEIVKQVMDYKPHIVHFSGHGVRKKEANPISGNRRGFGEENEPTGPSAPAGIETSSDGGLVVHSASNYGSFQIGSNFINGVFKVAKSNQIPVHTVVFNACHSAAVSEGVAAEVDHVIATTDEIGDEAAIEFSSTFYHLLIASKSTPKEAFQAAQVVTFAYDEPADRFIFYNKGNRE